MAQQVKHGGTFINDTTIGTIDWTNPGYAISSNDQWASVALAKGVISHYLKVTNFGFTIPTGSTINWVKVTVERHANNTLIKDNSIKLVKGGTIQGDDKPTATGWPASDTSEDHGGTDNWGLTLVVSDVNASDFGCVIAIKNNKTGAGATYTGYIDDIIITVDYTVASDFTYTGSGSYVFSGTATQVYTKDFLYITSGQFVYSGIAEKAYSKNYLFEGSGSLSFSGSAVIIVGLAYVGSGSLTYSGEAVQYYTRDYLCTAIGELLYSGAALFTYLCDFLFTGTGEFAYSGIAECNYEFGESFQYYYKKWNYKFNKRK